MAEVNMAVAPEPLRNISTWNNLTVEVVEASPLDYFQGSDIVWMMISSALVFLMVPGIALFYSGMGDRNSTFMLLRLPFITAAVTTVQWYLWGYALTFSAGSLWLGGSTSRLAFREVSASPIGADQGPAIPEIVYALFHGMFASFAAAIVCGGGMKRVGTIRFVVFILLWSILVYYPVARWTWYEKGWAKNRGIMDFAGGTAVHITTGTTVLAYVVWINLERHGRQIHRYFLPSHRRADTEARRRQRQRILKEDAPHNIPNLVLGTALLWIGWFGFNGGSALGGNLRAASACLSTHVAAATSGTVTLLITWIINAGFRGRVQRPQLVITHFCDGAIIGLVAITPAAGYVPVWSAGIFGTVAALGMTFLKSLFHAFRRHDPIFVWVIHAGGGFIGMFLTGCLASSTIVHFDGHTVLAERSTGERIKRQLWDAFAGFSYTFAMTWAIFIAMGILQSFLGVFMGDGLSWRLLFPQEDRRDHLVGMSNYEWETALESVEPTQSSQSAQNGHPPTAA